MMSDFDRGSQLRYGFKFEALCVSQVQGEHCLQQRNAVVEVEVTGQSGYDYLHSKVVQRRPPTRHRL